MDALSALLWSVLSKLCNTTHVNRMSLTTFGLCSIVPSQTLNLLVRISKAFSTTLLPLEILYFVILFSLEVVFCCRVSQAMSSGNGVVTQQKKMVQIWSSLPQRFRWRNPQGVILNFLFNLLRLKIYASIMKIHLT